MTRVKRIVNIEDKFESRLEGQTMVIFYELHLFAPTKRFLIKYKLRWSFCTLRYFNLNKILTSNGEAFPLFITL